MSLDFLDRRGLRLLLFGGKGGVGKTTCAVATGLRLAEQFPECSYLLVSTDPAHSLADSLAGCRPPQNLHLLEMDARQSLAAFQAMHGRKLREILSRGTFLDEDDTERLVNLSLPGLDELMAFLEISTWVLERRYECILVDTAPSGHMLRMLQVPGLLRNWLQVLDSLLAKHRYLRQVFTRSRAPDALDLYLKNFAASLRRMERLLRDPACSRFVPVLVAEALSVAETAAMVRELNWLRLPISELVVNRLYPESRCPACASARSSQCGQLRALSGEPALSLYPVWGVPVYPDEVQGDRALRAFWDGAAPVTETAAGATLPARALAPAAPAAAEELPPALRLLLIGGKGGVGKTTVACATAIGLATRYPGTRVLLFSADPAHSLSDCLDLPVEASPTQVIPGLSAVEVDARSELESLRAQYARDLEHFLITVSRNFDLSFDRQVMEQILDLAPPGLDEIMAQARVMDFLASPNFDVVVVDAAATGHLLRWLELPELMEPWIRFVFGLFRKYQRVIRAPRITARLAELSRHLKQLRNMLADRDSSRLYIVSILTDMALDETRDLVAACERLHLDVPAIILNLAVPARDCSLCSAIHRREAVVRRKYRESFPRQRQSTVYRQETPRGLAGLAEFAAAMYLPAGRRKEAVSFVS
ncbi:MAG: ArsA family ATPase [Acidobacteria bacterium]|nr:ArsA family ATPase [Acidobacteriota bacterium]